MCTNANHFVKIRVRELSLIYYDFKRKYILFEKFDKSQRIERLEEKQDDSFITCDIIIIL